MLYTTHYSYSGDDRVDITVQGNDPVGEVFAPTEEIQEDYKKYWNEEVYTRNYYNLLIQRWIDNYHGIRKIVIELIQKTMVDNVTLVCFCPNDTFCHRHLLVKWLIHNWPQVQYGGGRKKGGD